MAYFSAAAINERAQQHRMRRALFVTALALEMEAVRQHLTHLGSVIGRDGAVYECGLFSDLGQDWLVVVTETGAGTHPALSAVTNAHVAFGEFEVQILVGIGGSRKSEASIGNVVVSDYVYMPYSGKYGENGLSHRPRTFQVDGRLLGIARKVRRDGLWQARIRGADGSTLTSGNSYPVHFPPIALVAPIASIEAVLANPESELEALIATGYGDACVVEMEGYGAVYAASQERVPSILVRGVSDRTRDKTPTDDAVRQPVAARHAAAFAFEMLSHWSQAYPLNRTTSPGSDSIIIEVSPKEMDGESKEPVEVESDYDRTTSSSESRDAFALEPNYVLNFDESAPDVEGRLAAIETLLRQLLGNDRIRAVFAKKGSLHVFVADPDDVLGKLKPLRLRELIAQQDGGALFGFATRREYEKLGQLKAELRNASSELMSWPTALPGGERLARPEFDAVVDQIEKHSSSTTAVVGPPGAGKSTLLAMLANYFHEKGWPVLAIKADLLRTTIDSEEALRLQLGLSEPPSEILLSLAAFQPVLLFLDQLDALARFLDLRTGRLSVLLGLVRRLGKHDNVHVVLSSRTFEYQHDVRLQAVGAEAVELQLPAWSQILTILEGCGVHTSGWPEDAREVMRTPQALATYLQLQGTAFSEPFTSYQAVLDRLWAERVLVGEGGPRRSQLAVAIAELMADEESLWLARARFEGAREDVEALTASGILTTVEGSLGFTHQTLFEYALARGFAQKRGRLSAFVLERQESLFLRPKLWAGLNYLRSVEPSAYLAELETLWRVPDLRQHLRLLLIDFLGQQAKPFDREALVLGEALLQPRTRWAAFRALSGSEGWFARFSRTFIADGMTESPESADRMINVLSRAWSFSPDEVHRLLRELWLPDPNHDLRTWAVLEYAPRWTEGLLSLGCRVLERTPVSLWSVDSIARALSEGQPEAALRLVRTHLDRELANAKDVAERLAAQPKLEAASFEEELAWSLERNPRAPLERIIDRPHDWDSVPDLASNSPDAFLRILWPWFDHLFQSLITVRQEPRASMAFPLAFLADFQFEGEQQSGLPEPSLVAGLRNAVESLVESNPDQWLAWAETIGSIEAAPAQRLVAHGFTRNPRRFSENALQFLLTDQRRFILGSYRDQTETSARLVATASPFWSAENVLRFERSIATYKRPLPPDLTDPNDRRSWNRGTRRVRLALLRALPKQQLTPDTQRHVQEEERVFPARPTASHGVQVGFIGSTMSAGDMANAADADIINAFRTLPDASGWDHPRNWMVGGNIQLSREFANFAKDHPERAAKLLRNLEPKEASRAAGYVLETISESSSSDLVLEIFRDAVSRNFSSDEFRASASQALSRLLERRVSITDDDVGVLQGWIACSLEARGIKEPDRDENDTVEAGTKDSANDSIRSSLLWGYGTFSVVPGGDYPVLEALARLRIARNESQLLEETLRAYLEMNRDSRIWDHLLRFLPGLHPHDADRRALFLSKLFQEVPDLVGSKVSAQILAQSHWWNASFADRHLDRWRDFDKRLARQAYGEIVTLIAILNPDLTWASERLDHLEEDPKQSDARTGAALSAANLWNLPKHRPDATLLLTTLLDTSEPGVWTAAFEVFRLSDELKPDLHTVSLLTKIAERIHEAPKVDATYLVERLSALLPHYAMLVCRVAAGLVDVWRTELGDVQTSMANASHHLVDLAVTLHRLGPETREAGTALFEQLLEIEAWAARETLDEIDNRFRGRPPTRRIRRRRRPSASRLPQASNLSK